MIILFMVTRIFKRADEKRYGPAAISVFSKGNASDSVRKAVTGQLQKFQNGYNKRDVSQIDTFMKALYSEKNILILGTMPNEIFQGYSEATRLVKSDWESWGDCTFGVENASISANGTTVWIVTNGYVKFDLTKFLVMPLRITGIMVNEDGVWKFQQQQFQFDTDFSLNMLAVLLLVLWLAGSMVELFVIVLRRISQTKPEKDK